MKWLSAAVAFVASSTVAALLLRLFGHGITHFTAVVSLVVGVVIAIFAGRGTSDQAWTDQDPSARPVTSLRRSRKGSPSDHWAPYRSAGVWVLAACFALYAFRSFFWLIYIEGNQLKVQSPNNLGDLALHITYIKNFLHGSTLWPDNPIFPFGQLRYPAGIDIFNSVLTAAGVNLISGLVWTALLASAAACFALYRWAGGFGIAGFLFNGGLAGYQVLQTGKFLDYQGDKTIAWKSIALAMLTTQRGLLYAIPVGLLLLCSWRVKFFAAQLATEQKSPRAFALPFWLELTLYATLPLFHVHTFMALSIVLVFLFLLGDGERRKALALLVGAALVPATFFVWLVTDRFNARSILSWCPGWVQRAPGDFAAPFFHFWLLNFGLTIPLILLLLGLVVWRTGEWRQKGNKSWPLHFSFLIPATAIFLFACFVKTAPWEWDNTKLIIWAYFIFLPFLWRDLIKPTPVPVQVGVCVALFGSGFVTMVGGLAAGRPGYTVAERAEVDGVGSATRKLPENARYASYPTYNHPLLLSGRKVVLGYPGHLWTQGFDYSDAEQRLTKLMNGAADWREQARYLGVRYLFWGREEKTFYPASKKLWAAESVPVAKGSWGVIYDLAQPRTPAPAVP